MLPRHLRALVLVIAGWALLFAPGAAHEADDTVVERDHIGAAVAAPTMGSDAGTLLSRSGRACDDVEYELTGPPLASAVPVVVGGTASTRACTEPPGRPPSQLPSRPVSARAPPVV